jgi:hypothetical protein
VEARQVGPYRIYLIVEAVKTFLGGIEMKFKASTHQLIDQTIKELLQPVIEAGKTYRFHTMYGVIERPVESIVGDTVTYSKPGKKCTCSLKAFRRLYAEHGIKEAE